MLLSLGKGCFSGGDISSPQNAFLANVWGFFPQVESRRFSFELSRETSQVLGLEILVRSYINNIIQSTACMFRETFFHIKCTGTNYT